MEQWVTENIRQREELAHRIYGTYRYWKVSEGEAKKDAWRDYIAMRKQYKALMGEFDTDGRIAEHKFLMERYERVFRICRYWPWTNGKNGNGNHQT